jgi:hypothetical protein
MLSASSFSSGFRLLRPLQQSRHQTAQRIQ